MARIHSFLPHILLLMSVYTATMMKAEPLIRSSTERSPSQGVDIVDNIDTNPYDYSDSDQGLDDIETLYPDNEVNAALHNNDPVVIETIYPDNEVNAAPDNRDPVVTETHYPDNEVVAALLVLLKFLSPENSVSGSTYIRWGRGDCPATADIVYSGLAAAPSRLVRGGGSNYLCIPETLLHNSNSQPKKERKRSYIYTVKYRDDFPLVAKLVGLDVPCAVCESIGRNTMLMAPFNLSCPNSAWNLEYGGFLMAERETHYRVQYVCLDRNPTASSYTDQWVTGNGNSTTRIDKAKGEKFASVQPVEARCPSIFPCGDPLPCTVCTK